VVLAPAARVPEAADKLTQPCVLEPVQLMAVPPVF
jgi:hypothetical protein